MATTPTIWQASFTVAALRDGTQVDSQVIALGDGSHLVAWTSAASAYNPTSIVSVIYDFDGQILQSEGELDGFLGGSQLLSSLSSFGNGQFALAYVDQFIGGNSIQASTIDLAGNAVDYVISTDFTASAPAILAAADGSFTVAYQRHNGSDLGIYAKTVAANGSIGAEFAVFDFPTTSEELVQLARLSNGNIVATMLHVSATPGLDVRYAIFTPAGAPVANGNIGAVASQLSEAQVAALTGGGFVAVFSGQADGSGSGIGFEVRSNTGALIGSGTVNSTTTGDQFEPVVTALRDGGFLVVWADAAAGVLRGQRFDASGAKVGTEFVAADSDGFWLSIAELDDGRVFLSYSNTGANPDVHGVILDPRGDTITFGSEANAIAARREGGTVIAGGGDDIVVGYDGADSLDGGDGNDTLEGGGGNDTLIGGAGIDHMTGGSGNDTYLANSSDTLIELANGGIDTVVSDETYTLVNHFENLQLTGTAIVGTGNGLDNAITGNDQANRLRGLDGSDTLTGGLGNDTLEGGQGNDRYIVDAGDTLVEKAGEGIDSVYSSVSFTLGVNIEMLFLTGSALAATGNLEDNRITGNAEANFIHGMAGNDRLFGMAGDDRILGGSGNDLLDGGTGNDTLLGGAGNDVVRGHAGNDVIWGGAGRDILSGGDGRDVFDFDAISHSRTVSDLILDFVRGQDRIDLSTIDAVTGVAGNQAFRFIADRDFGSRAGELRIVAVDRAGAGNGITLVQGDVNGDGRADFSIALTGLHALSTSDFYL